MCAYFIVWVPAGCTPIPTVAEIDAGSVTEDVAATVGARVVHNVVAL